MSRFTDLFQPPIPAPAPAPEVKEAEVPAKPAKRSYKKK
jgi:hypothetical protein